MPRAQTSPASPAPAAGHLMIQDLHPRQAGQGVLRSRRADTPPPCFQSHGVYSCEQPDCPWRESCEQAVSPWMVYP